MKRWEMKHIQNGFAVRFGGTHRRVEYTYQPEDADHFVITVQTFDAQNNLVGEPAVSGPFHSSGVHAKVKELAERETKRLNAH